MPIQTLLLAGVVALVFYGAVPVHDLELRLPPSRDDGWWTYVTSLLVHSGQWHLWNNMFLLLVAGGIFEAMHGGFAVQGVFWVAGITGSLAEATRDSAEPRIYMGMSPAVLGLVGAYVGHLALNWSETRFRLTFLVGILVYTGLSIAWYAYEPKDDIAYLSHIAGATQGVYVGIVAVHNQRLVRGERTLRVIGLVLSAGAVVLTVFRVGQNAIRHA